MTRGARQEALVSAGQKAREVLPVATEHLVGAHAVQQHRHPIRPGRIGDEEGVDRRGIGDRLIEMPHQLGQECHDVWRDFQLAMITADALRDPARIATVFVRYLQSAIRGPEHDREGVHGFPGVLLHQRDDRR